MFRKFLIWLTKNIIILLLATLVFSTIALDVPSLIKGLFNDIFSYASPETQKEVVGKLTLACSELDEKDLNELQQQTASSSLPIDLSKVGSLCKDYNSKKINDKEFFFNVIGSALPDSLELPNTNALEKYYATINFLNNNKIIYFTILMVLLLMLYLLVGNLNPFLIMLSSICFSIGMLILAPYIAVIAYDRLIGIDTTPLLKTILGSNFSFDIKAMISVVLLMVLRTYNNFIITIGIVLISIGIAGRVYSYKLKNKVKTAKTKKDAKEKEDYEKERKRQKSTKEILDELEGMHKKKMKEKEQG